MSVNSVTIVGYVGKNPDMRYFEGGNMVATFPLATTEKGYTTENGIKIPDKTEWHTIIATRGLAKIAEQFVRKGNKVFVQGSIRSRSYEDSQKIKRYVYEIYINHIEVMDRREESRENENDVKNNGELFPPLSAGLPD